MYDWQDNECLFRVIFGNSTATECVLPCYPEEINETVKAIWSPTTIVGRTGSLSAFVGTEDEDVSFTLKLHREMEIPGSGKTVEDLIRIMKSACYPNYNASHLQPPRSIFKLGNFYIAGRLSSLSLSWSLPIIEQRYSVCDVSVSMQSACTKILGNRDIINGGIGMTYGLYDSQ